MRSIYRAMREDSRFKRIFYVTLPAIGLAAVLNGCFSEAKPAEPKREDYNAESVSVDPYNNMNISTFHLIDDNHDKHVDLIKRFPSSYIFIAPGFHTDLSSEEGAREMTPEEQQMADQMLNGASEFSYKAAKASFDAESQHKPKQATEPIPQFLGTGEVRK